MSKRSLRPISAIEPRFLGISGAPNPIGKSGMSTRVSPRRMIWKYSCDLPLIVMGAG